MNDEKVILPMEEYKRLKEAEECLKLAREELKKDSQERGYYVELTVTARDTFYDHWYKTHYIQLIKPVKVVTKDEVIELLNGKLENAHENEEAMAKEVKELEAENQRLRSRNIFKRIFNIS